MADYTYDIERISEEIQLYLLQHPNAADTLEGITKWWLTRQRYEEATHVVKKALEDLIAQGLIVQTTNSDDQRIYRKAKEEIQPTWTKQ